MRLRAVLVAACLSALVLVAVVQAAVSCCRAVQRHQRVARPLAVAYRSAVAAAAAAATCRFAVDAARLVLAAVQALLVAAAALHLTAVATSVLLAVPAAVL